MIKEGNKYANAETQVNYKSKTIDFYYNNKEYNKKYENLAFYGHSFYQMMGLILSLSMLLFWLEFMILNIGDNPSEIGAILLCIGMFACFFGGQIIMGYTSIIVHRLSKTARKNFPVSNAIGRNIRKWKEIDLSQNKEIYYEGTKQRNKFIHWNYDIVRFEYKYIGLNKIKRVYTKSKEKPKHKGEHYDYVCIFEFEKPIKDGIIYWR